MVNTVGLSGGSWVCSRGSSWVREMLSPLGDPRGLVRPCCGKHGSNVHRISEIHGVGRVCVPSTKPHMHREAAYASTRQRFSPLFHPEFAKKKSVERLWVLNSGIRWGEWMFVEWDFVRCTRTATLRRRRRRWIPT